MNIIESFRSQVIKATMSIPSMHSAWPVIHPTLSSYVPHLNNLTNRHIFDLGDHLSAAFLSVGGTRGQSNVGQAGVVWESLIIWYLNICLCGTNAVAFKGNKAFIPKTIDKALTVTHENVALRSETDTLLVHLDNNELLEEIDPEEESLRKYKQIIDDHYSDVKLINIQCKTNWNDIAQIPMLWNLIYSPTFQHDYVGVGINGYNISSFSVFRYVFVTVPTQRHYNFTPNCLPVLRVRTCSGGNYWGKPTQSGISFSIKEIFGRNQSNSALPNLSLIGDTYVNAAKNDSTQINWRVYSLFT